MVRSRGRNTALRRLCFPIPILAPLACMMEAGAATPCDLVAERVGGLYVETATALNARERKDAVAVCRYRGLAGPAIDSYRREDPLPVRLPAANLALVAPAVAKRDCSLCHHRPLRVSTSLSPRPQS